MTKLTWLISVLFQFLSRRVFFYRNKILSTCNFYYRNRKLLCRDKEFVFNISLCRNMNFFVVIPLVLFFNFYVTTENSLSRQNSPQSHVLFVAIEIIFIATEILLLFVVNSKCNVATRVSLLRQKFFLELASC